MNLHTACPTCEKNGKFRIHPSESYFFFHDRDMGAYLSNPVRVKVASDGSNDRFSFGSCEMQGWRKYMEDSHFEIGNFTYGKSDCLFGLFDGHGGPAVARFCRDHFPAILRSNPEFEKGNFEEALRHSFLKLDEMLVHDEDVIMKLKGYTEGGGTGRLPSPAPVPTISSVQPLPRRFAHDGHPASHSGCTAVVLYISHEGGLYVANSGDSRAVLCRNGDSLDLTVDHKVTVESELDRIRSAGGVIINGRVNGSLNLTRAIGDLSFKCDPSLSPENQVITAIPDTQKIEIDFDSDDFIILACDGLWEVMKSQEVVDYVLHGMRGIRGFSPTSATMTGVSLAGFAEESDPPSPASSASLVPTCISELLGNILDVACSEDVGKTEGVGGDNLSCILIDLRPGKPLVNIDRVSKSGDPFLSKPSGLKAFEFRTGTCDDDDDGFDGFGDQEWECRIERIDESDFPNTS